MEVVKFDKDIIVFYVTAGSFPDGIQAAHQELHRRLPFSTSRKYFGISRPEHDAGIIYRAAAEELEEGEAKKYDCSTLVLRKGNYISLLLHDYMSDLSSIGKAFEELLDHPDIDPQGYCVELYLSEKEVRCMVRVGN